MTDVRLRPVLRIGLSRDDDVSAEMHVSFEAEGVAGKSSGWFGIEELGSQVERFSHYPLDPRDPPEIRSGYLAQGEDRFIFECVYLSAKPLGVRGEIVVTFRLSYLGHRSFEENLSYKTSGYIMTNYQNLKRFTEDVKSLIEGNADKAELFETDF